MTDIYAPDLQTTHVQAWFGGSFDPVHLGHLIAAQHVVECLHLDRLHFIPCKLSPHKQRTACTAEDRIEMLRLALADCEYFDLDLREIERESASYSVDTLKDLRAQFGDDCSLAWVIGWDAFLSLHQWHRWEEISGLCNLVVVNRPGFTAEIPQALNEWCIGREVVAQELSHFHFGKLLFLETPRVEISSSDIRERCRRNLPINFLVPTSVAHYIKENRLFLENIE